MGNLPPEIAEKMIGIGTSSQTGESVGRAFVIEAICYWLKPRCAGHTNSSCFASFDKT